MPKVVELSLVSDVVGGKSLAYLDKYLAGEVGC
jgi:hypothetical protein